MLAHGQGHPRRRRAAARRGAEAAPTDPEGVAAVAEAGGLRVELDRPGGRLASSTCSSPRPCSSETSRAAPASVGPSMANDERDRTPTSRFSRTARIGGLVAGQGARVAGGRAVDRVRSDDAKARAQRKRTAAVVEQIVVQLGQMKGAAMKLGQVLSTVDLPGPGARGRRAHQAAPRRAARQRAARRVRQAREADGAGVGREGRLASCARSTRRPSPPPRSARSTAR